MRVLGDAELTPTERRVVADTTSGESTDFRQPDDVVAAGAAWGPGRAVRAEVLVQLLTDQQVDSCLPRAVSVAGARITGRLDLEALTLLRPLVLNDCYFEQAVILDEARCARLDFSGSRLPALRARQLETRGDLTLDRITEVTAIALAGGRIGGVLSLRAARLIAAGDTVVDGERLEVHVEMDCGGLRADDELSLLGAHVGGSSTCVARA